MTKQYKAVFARWPKDQLRELKLQELLSEHLDDRLNGRLAWTTPTTAAAIEKATGKAPQPVAPTDLAQLKQVNALLSLLDDRYMKANRITGDIMKPRSNPTYYQDIITELEEAPKRSWLGRVQKKLQGMFRFS